MSCNSRLEVEGAAEVGVQDCGGGFSELVGGVADTFEGVEGVFRAEGAQDTGESDGVFLIKHVLVHVAVDEEHLRKFAGEGASLLSDEQPGPVDGVVEGEGGYGQVVGGIGGESVGFEQEGLELVVADDTFVGDGRLLQADGAELAKQGAGDGVPEEGATESAAP